MVRIVESVLQSDDGNECMSSLFGPTLPFLVRMFFRVLTLHLTNSGSWMIAYPITRKCKRCKKSQKRVILCIDKEMYFSQEKAYQEIARCILRCYQSVCENQQTVLVILFSSYLDIQS